MGALAPIAGLLNSAGSGGGTGGAASTPPLDNFFGLDSRFLKAPAGGTALFNNVLFGASNQQVPIDFLGMGFYTGVPPIFGGAGFTGLPSRFDLFAGPRNPVGVDAVLGLQNAVNGTSANPASALLARTAADNKGISAGAATPAASVPASGSLGLDSLKTMKLGDLLKLLA